MPGVGGRAARVVAVVLAVAAVAGCTSDGAEPPASTTSTTTGAPVEGGTVRLGIGGPLVVDPVDASLASPSDLMVLDLLHDGLTRLSAGGVPEPALASEWDANDAFTAFQFTLRPGITFATGDPIRAEDVIASWERVMAAGDTSLTALSLESVKGFGDFADGKAKHVSGFSVPEDGIVRVELTGPLSVLPEVLSNPVLGVIDVHSIDTADLAGLDLSGSWTATSSDDGLRVERREGAPGHLDAVELRPYDDPEAAYGAFDAGEVDWAEVPASRYDDAVADHGDEAFAPFHAELFFGMNLSSKNLASAGMRTAIRLAIDREAIVEAVYPSLADVLPTVVPAGVVGHDPDRCADCGYDPEAAADIVRYTFPDGKVPTIHIDFDASAPQDAMADLIAADLEEAGIPTELRPLPLDEYKEFVVSGDQELFSFGWIGAYGSPDAFLAPLFGSAANDNLTDYRSDDVDELLLAARKGKAAPQNRSRWERAEAQVLEDAVVVPIAQFRVQAVVGDSIEGLTHAVDGTVDWSRVQRSG